MNTEQLQEPRVKIYTLLKSSKSPAKVFRKIQGQRVRVEERPISHAHGKITFFDKVLKRNMTIRLKLNCDSIDLQEQIKVFMIPANEKVTQTERDVLKFRFGSLVTDNPLVQKFLEASPEFEPNWKGKKVSCNSIKGPKYTLYDEAAELEVEDKLYLLRVKAANVIAELKDLQTAQELMIRLNGSYFEAPDTLLKCRKGLIAYLDEAGEPELNKILQKEVSIDEEVRLLIGKAINYKVISFDAVKGQVVELAANGKHKELKQISNEHSEETRMDMFVEFVNSEDGKGLKKHLEKKVKEKEK